MANESDDAPLTRCEWLRWARLSAPRWSFRVLAGVVRGVGLRGRRAGHGVLFGLIAVAGCARTKAERKPDPASDEHGSMHGLDERAHEAGMHADTQRWVGVLDDP